MLSFSSEREENWRRCLRNAPEQDSVVPYRVRSRETLRCRGVASGVSVASSAASVSPEARLSSPLEVGASGLLPTEEAVKKCDWSISAH